MTVLEHAGHQRGKATATTSEDATISRSCASANTPLRIVHLVSTLRVGGMEQFVLRIADEQRRRGHEVAILGLRGGPLEEQAASLGLPVVTLDGCDKARRLLRAALFLRRFRPDIANAHNPSSLAYALLARLVQGTRVVITRHGQGHKPIDSLRWRFTDAAVAVSEAAAAAMRSDNPGYEAKISVIHNGVSIASAGDVPISVAAAEAVASRREMIRASLGIHSDTVVGIVVARIDNLKGHDSLVEALATLRLQRREDEGTAIATSTVPSLTMLVAGDGPERANIEEKARHLGLGPDEIRFLGFRSDVDDLLSASDFFVLPSLSEGLPLSVLEAMAHRLPVIATPVGGIPEVIIDGEHGFLTPVNDSQALARCIARLSDAPALVRHSLGEAAYQRVVMHFSFESMTEKYDMLYRRLLR